MRLAQIWNPVRSHPGLALGCLIALAAQWLLPLDVPAVVRGVLGWDILVAVFLAMSLATMLRSQQDSMHRRAAQNDSGDAAVLFLCLAAVTASLIAIMTLVIGIREMAPAVKTFRLGLAISTVAGSWLFLHTVLALHYAHAYYWPKHQGKGTAHIRGLEFPGDEAPDYADFLYFSFVLGATSQTSDVAITGKYMRRLATLHGILSFAFNTVLLALTVNVAASLL